MMVFGQQQHGDGSQNNMVINHTAQLASLTDKLSYLDKKTDDSIKVVDDKIDNHVVVINKELEKQYNQIAKLDRELKDYMEKERQRYETLENKIDDFYKWLLATIAAFVVSLLMFLFQLFIA
jgi:hypothetical protein